MPTREKSGNNFENPDSCSLEKKALEKIPFLIQISGVS